MTNTYYFQIFHNYLFEYFKFIESNKYLLFEFLILKSPEQNFNL
jgi:hypothetical protein